jgi:hypothetical protein
VYDDDLTAAFFATADALMRPGEELWLTLEKRLNFSLPDLSVVAHGYRTFLTTINALPSEPVDSCVSDDVTDRTAGARGSKDITGSRETTGTDSTDSVGPVGVVRTPSGRAFRGERVPLDFPQRVLDYERVEGLELWRIRLS